MNASAFASIMMIVIFAFIGGMIYVFKRNQVEPEEKHIEKQTLNDLAPALDAITKHTQVKVEEKKDDKDDVKYKSNNVIKEIQEKNHMKKSPADEYFERLKLIESQMLKQKK